MGSIQPMKSASRLSTPVVRDERGRLRRRARFVAVTLLAAAGLGGVMAPLAQAYTYDYSMYIPVFDTSWHSRSVAHNYNYIRMSIGSSVPYICVKLTRTSDGTNYGDVYCNYYQTGHHYAGDTGTLSWGKQSGSFVSDYYPYHEEW